MSKTTNTFAAFFVASLVTVAVAQEGQRLAGATVIDHSGYTNLPNFIKLNPTQQMSRESFVNWAVYALNVPNTSTFKPYETFSDEYGFTHTRYKQYMNGIPVEGTQVIAHSKEGKVQMVNGDYYLNFSEASTASLNESDALFAALKKVNAQKYMWEDKVMEALQRQSNPEFSTYFPKGELVYVHKKGTGFSAENMRLAYKFNVYAEVPLYRANVFVDANNGQILDEQNLICTADVVGTGVTKYSGSKAMTCDNTTGPFRLREVGRGNGIETYNLSGGTTYGSATDFTNGSSTWNLPGTDQAASDAHWGAEMTYDYYKLVHNRNSIDGAGFKLKSYVHYSTGLVNAFWNGAEMSYGDGNGSSYTIMTALDICGHEITHGLTAYTAGLSGGNEPGALNEGFSDIFGTTIEWYARPTQKDWLMGADVMPSGQGLRDMSNPKNLGQPNCYLGTYWDAVNQEVHNNDGPAIYWYYLLCQGGSGTNDIGNAYNVTGQTMAKARLIAFRGLTVYFTGSTTYANARTFTEQAATDIYGSCSNELGATSAAWYAVGVGPLPTGGAPLASFSTGPLGGCTMPVTVNFANSSSGAQSYAWNFGDGGTSTTASPSHTYTLAGTYTVTLVATGCGGGQTNTLSQVITIGPIGSALPLMEGFEGLSNIPAGWSLYNPDADAAWQVLNTVAKTGTNCIGFNNCSGDGNTDMTGRIDRVDTKAYSFVNVASATMTFDVAYAVLTYSGTPYYDGLKVKASTDCGVTWTTIYTKAGATLATAPGYTIPQPCWAPSGASQWRNDNINLSSVLGQSNVIFGFENTSAWGTWIYLDNINITGTMGININSAEGVSIYPNPAHNNLNVKADQNINSVRIIDMLGKTVSLSFPEEKTLQVDISSLPAGIYFVKVSAGDAQKLIKLVKE